MCARVRVTTLALPKSRSTPLENTPSFGVCPSNLRHIWRRGPNLLENPTTFRPPLTTSAVYCRSCVSSRHGDMILLDTMSSHDKRRDTMSCRLVLHALRIFFVTLVLPLCRDSFRASGIAMGAACCARRESAVSPLLLTFPSSRRQQLSGKFQSYNTLLK